MRFTLKTLVLVFLCLSLGTGLFIKHREVNDLKEKLVSAEARAACSEFIIIFNGYDGKTDEHDITVNWTRKDGTELQTNMREGMAVKVSIDNQILLVRKPGQHFIDDPK